MAGVGNLISTARLTQGCCVAPWPCGYRRLDRSDMPG
jgi:hypothetical protein